MPLLDEIETDPFPVAASSHVWLTARLPDSPFRVIPLPVAPIGRGCIIGILQTREVEPVTMVEVIILESWTVVLVAILGALIVAAVIFAAIQVRRENRRNIAIGYGSTSKRKSAEKDNGSW